TTVSRALSNHYSIGIATKQRVIKLAKELDYQPNHLATALRKGKSRLLGVIVPYVEGTFFSTVIKSIEQAASKAGLNVIICQSHEDAVLEQRSVETLLHAQVVGLVVSLAKGTRNFHHFIKVRERGIPLVFFDRVPISELVNAVVFDDREAARQAVHHLINQGAQRIAHLAGPQHLNIYHQRCLGYQEALLACGLPVLSELIIVSNMNVEDGRQATQQLMGLASPPDGIFGAGDSAILGALQVLKKQGINVPHQVKLVGFSNENFTLITEPQLSSVDQRCEEMGTAVVRLFLELTAAPKDDFVQQQIQLQPNLCYHRRISC
ncbi:MAG: LacI family transcriptional regulator, partial [Hymenobacter sp.]